MQDKQKKNGYVILLVVGIAAILFILIAGLAHSVVNEKWFSHQERDSLISLEIAEAGIDYYTWFLNHNHEDFQNGEGEPGPYSIEYEDGDGNKIGYFQLDISEPEIGSTIGTVHSTGFVYNSTAPSRSIDSRIGVPSLAKYAFLTESDIWFGDSESVDGKLHSNGGIRFDGTCNDAITSAKETYTCQPMHGCSFEEKPGVWGTGGPDSFWEMGVSAEDFDQISGDLDTLEELADPPDGLNLGESNKYGWHIVFFDNNTATPDDDFMDIYKVMKVYVTSGWVDTELQWVNFGDDIKQQNLTYDNEPMPANGVIFADDDVWVSGETSSRVTVAAAHFPESDLTYRDIILYDDLLYYAKDGTAVIGLIAQGDVRSRYATPNNLEIDAIMLAQNGRVFRPYYLSSVKNSITTYGGIITFKVWTWTWVNGGGGVVSGYQTTNSVYDPHLIYAPPPYFPTTGVYEVLKWEEVMPQ